MSGKTRQATIPVTEIEQAAFCKTEEDLPANPPAQDLAVDIYCLLHGGHIPWRLWKTLGKSHIISSITRAVLFPRPT